MQEDGKSSADSRRQATVSGFFERFWGDCMVLWVVATSAMTIGLLLNTVRDKPLGFVYQSKAERMQESVARIAGKEEAPVGKPSAARRARHVPEVLSLEEFAGFVEEKRGLVLDARPEIFHRLGHVPSAVSLPRDDFEKAYAGLKERLENDKAQPLAVYCSGPSCEDSELVRNSLVALGFSNVGIFKDGWSGWTTAGKPEERTQ